MNQKLELVCEEKLFRLLPGKKEGGRLEASGIAIVDENTALVVFDNLNLVAQIDLSLKSGSTNKLLPAPSIGLGFEDIAIDHKQGRFFCLIEAMEDFDGVLRGFVVEYDLEGRFQSGHRLHTKFENANKGFEGLAHVRLKDRECLYALCESNMGRGAKQKGGRVDVFARGQDGDWNDSHQILLPKSAEFEDYAALAYRNGQVAIVSQESARLWICRIDEQELAVVPGSDAVYRFPSKSYGNVEGIDWLSEDTLVAVSDRKKKSQSDRCAEKDQSIHIFRIPASELPETS